MTSETRVCGVNKCTKPRAATQLACRTHWFMLPKALRDEVWRTYTRDPGGDEHSKAITKCLAWWRENAPVAVKR